MKKLLVTGSVLFAVMPAFAAPVLLDLTKVIQENSNNTCEGNDYSGSSVSLQPVYLPVCTSGNYLSTDGASVGSDGKITGATCQSCGTGYYCPGTENVSVPSMEYSTIGREACPEGWKDGQNATSISECGASCPTSLGSGALSSLHASSATTNGNNGVVNYPTVCAAAISACETGYTKVDLVGTGSSYKYCDINEKSDGNDCKDLGKSGLVEISGNNGEYTYTGSVSCAADGMCTLTIDLGKAVDSINQQYKDQGTCETECGADATWQARIADVISRNMTKSASIPASGGVFCIGNGIVINWGGVNIQNTCIYGSQLDIPSTTPTPEQGYKFIGWRPYNNNQ